MPHFRVTIRYGHPRLQYALLDVEAADLRAALRAAAENFPPTAEGSADLVEIRRQAPAEEREYVPES